jgi:hypothetical protein
MTIYRGDWDSAAAIVLRDSVDYVAMCRTGVFMRESGPGSFGAALLAGKPPVWLKPVESDRGAYVIYRVDWAALGGAAKLRGRIAD